MSHFVNIDLRRYVLDPLIKEKLLTQEFHTQAILRAMYYQSVIRPKILRNDWIHHRRFKILLKFGKGSEAATRSLL